MTTTLVVTEVHRLVLHRVGIKAENCRAAITFDRDFVIARIRSLASVIGRSGRTSQQLEQIPLAVGPIERQRLVAAGVEIAQREYVVGEVPRTGGVTAGSVPETISIVD